MHKPLVGFAICLALGAGTGCSMISGSITSISDAAVGIVKSVSGSSKDLLHSSGIGGGSSSLAEEDRYREDLRLATRSFAEKGQVDTDFVRALGRVAEGHGVTHWEAIPGSWYAIGAGLHQGGLTEPEVDTTLARLELGNELERALAREGWRAVP